jgi:hypothetical protein
LLVYFLKLMTKNPLSSKAGSPALGAGPKPPLILLTYALPRMSDSWEAEKLYHWSYPLAPKFLFPPAFSYWD